jgi:RNA polymerase sigma factor (TIGR02999 family)
MNEVAQLLQALDRGDPQAAAQLLPLVYDELRHLAAALLAAEPSGNTLQSTALVHEAYLRLVGTPGGDHWDHRGRFFAAAAEAMRRILVDAARRMRREKHGGDWARISLDAAQPHDRRPIPTRSEPWQ